LQGSVAAMTDDLSNALDNKLSSQPPNLAGASEQDGNSFFLWLLMPWVWVDGLQFHAVNTFSCSSSVISSSDTDFVPCCSQDLWIGEADNPGPVDQFENLKMDSYAPATTSFVRIGCSNAGGLRGKKSQALQIGSGIWCLSETHLTLAAQRSVSSTFSQFGQKMNRKVRVHFGVPVAIRSNSTTAGTLSGVGLISDFPSRDVMLAIQHGERSSGRD